MRTSNKILLSVFLAVLLIPTCLYLTLYAKYKSGHYERMKNVLEDAMVRYRLHGARYVVAHGLEDFHIIPADTLQLEIEKNKNGFVKFEMIGDSLIIHGDSVFTRKDGSTDIMRSGQSVTLRLPATEKIMLDFCDVRLKVDEDSNHAKSYHFELDNSSSFQLSDNPFQDSTNRYINFLSIKAANSSRIEFSNYRVIKNCELNFSDVEFDDKKAQIEKLSITADKKSGLSLNGANLANLNNAMQH